MIAAPPIPKAPPADVVDVWCVPLDVPASRLVELTTGLDDDERGQWARMRVGADRWAVARGARRAVLASYLGVPASSLRFHTDPLGKPRLVDTPGLEFNTSARDGVAVIAVASGREVGVDIECERTVRDEAHVAAMFLGAEDQAALALAEPDARRRTFADAWSRHEALRKSRGLALEDPMPDADAVAREVAAPKGFSVAVAADGDDWRVRVRSADEVLPGSAEPAGR
jgi:4'-phosphopantetheinyl transferase